ncbi:TadE/TadG family type IV pilus assembly protein [Litoreibacter halocynthiae]|uniref:TadE/TadG family type IV pilus assembly protein n=1 Tax=Litoreibacter halocynthiae TaxID=1242689 RepID=UPI0024915C1C|nr:pilus assembly protein TadG-related protein [Litoreibacter halocynthiae]
MECWIELLNVAKVPVTRAQSFARDEDGSYTAFGAFMLVTFLLLGSTAIDYSNAFTARTQMQVAADAAAHAALYTRDTQSAADAKEAALQMVEDILPASIYGTVLKPQDIVFGDYDREDDTFAVSASSKGAVEVKLQRTKKRENGVRTFLLHFVGKPFLDVTTTALAETYRPLCFREGFVADDVVDLQSNNTFENGFCVHSNSYVSMNQNNVFEDGTIVQMPDTGDLDIPSSGFERNDGLEASLRSGGYHLRIVNRIDDIIAGVQTLGSDYTPGFITTGTALYPSGSGKKFDVSDFTKGRVHVLSCGGNGVTLNAGLYSEIVIVASCPIKFSHGVVLEDIVVATTSTDPKSFNASSGLVVGKDDGCADGGMAWLVTKGGFEVAADLHIYGSQILAAGDIEFAAGADGVEGASIVAGGKVDVTSNNAMGFCGGGMDSAFQAEYFRLAN